MIIEEELNLNDIIKVVRGHEKIEISQNALSRIERFRTYVEEFLKSGKPIYGINTGFGALDRVKIPHDEINELQENLIGSYSAGVGELFSEDIVRAMMLLRINSVSKGYSVSKKRSSSPYDGYVKSWNNTSCV